MATMAANRVFVDSNILVYASHPAALPFRLEAKAKLSRMPGVRKRAMDQPSNLS